MKKLNLLTIILLIFAIPSLAQDKVEAYDQDVRKLLELTGSTATFNTVIDQMIGNYRQSDLGVPDEFWDQVLKEFKKDPLEELYKMILPIYKRHLTHEEIRGLITFYESEIGKTFIEKMPMIMQESMQAGSEWGQMIAEKITRKLKEEGY